MLTLAHAGADVVALVTDQPRHQSYTAFAFAAAARWRVPVWTSAAVRRIAGRGRLDGVELADLPTGTVSFVECDMLVFTADWIPDHGQAQYRSRSGRASTSQAVTPRDIRAQVW